ncbi:sugar ABC transporter substrate-binding protein [Salinisphaera sp. LB1]|uniref:sugar ABC transporter substrate-binding protein n=1 Tax=Salinisphaera sp. LB1 TaxID=2183911 RepID=UPI000D705099|nr:sugar ABC transporter substrate-binding protein [Salinisphaera sp. LB1]AWN16773.1 sugar ABC transporter, periplasmic sugar-binding protein [Salinisphaera sp. LB1]
MSDSSDHNDKNIDVSRRRILHGALSGGAGLAALTGMGISPAAFAAGKHNTNLPNHPKYKFVFINHVTTNPFFVPTQYGAADACAAFGCTYQWTGSQKSEASVMVNAMDAAISSGVDGIAVALVDQHAFNKPVDRALKAGIPVVSYNADVNNDRLAYIGQKLFDAGKALGQRIVDEVGSGDVVGFIATPGQLNIQPRLNGAKQAIKESGKNITLHEVASGPTVNEEFSRIESFYLGHRNIKGMFAVDAGSTEGVAKTMKKHNLAQKGIKAGGFDMLPGTLDGIESGDLSFTIDQQPYLQGFIPVMELYLYQLSGGLSGIANVNTGLKFVTKDNVGEYLNTKSRFEGNSSKEKVLSRSGPISS